MKRISIDREEALKQNWENIKNMKRPATISSEEKKSKDDVFQELLEDIRKISKKTKITTLPPIPIDHLTISEFEELREHIFRITGYKVVFELTDKKTKKKLGSI